MNQTTSQTASGNASLHFKWLFLGLVVLATVGIAIMDFSARYGLWYWLAMAPIFGGASIAIGWQKAAAETSESAGHFLRRQLLHWGALIVAMLLVFLQQHTLSMPPTTAGLIALLMLSLATLLAGVHFQWRMAVVGAILAVTYVAAIVVDQFFWLMLILAVVAGAIMIFVQHKPSATPSDPS